MFDFQINHEYLREDLLEFVDSKQQQSGIIWGPKEPGCVIVTSGGRHGKSAGYHDGKNEDGSWSYIGQGSKGHQDPERFSNSLLTNQQKSVILFSTKEPNSKEAKERGNRKKRYKFEGIFEVLSWGKIKVTEGKRLGDQLVVYHLIPSNNIFNDFEVEAAIPIKNGLTLEDLEKKIKDTPRKNEPRIKLTVQEYKERSRLVKTYALLRANGVCELCKKPAPFVSEAGIPFLEVHHIFRLADDGPDTPENVAALCPNCHREAHFGKEKDYLKKKLSKLALV
jgi:5-methylcytosine-specific restriction protein A